MCSLVKVKRPTIGRKGFQLQRQGDQNEKYGYPATFYGSEVGSHDVVNIKGAGVLIDEDDPDQQKPGDDAGGDQVLETGRHGFCFPVQQYQAHNGYTADLQKDKQVEDVAGHHHHIQSYKQQQIYDHGVDSLFLQAVKQIKTPQQTDDIDQGGEEGLHFSHQQIDGEGRSETSRIG